MCINQFREYFHIFTQCLQIVDIPVVFVGPFQALYSFYASIVINGCQKLYLTDQLDWLLRIDSCMKEGGRNVKKLD